MGNVSSTQAVRPPEMSLNPLLAAQAHNSVLQASRSGSGSRQQVQQETKLQQLSIAGFFAQWFLFYVLGQSYFPQIEAKGVDHHWHFAVLSFLSVVSRSAAMKYVESHRDEADSQAFLSIKDRVKAPGRRGSSRYRGLSWHKGVGKWAVQLRINGSNQQLGYYEDEESAAKVYDHYVILTRSADAPTNFPRPPNGQGYDLSQFAASKRRRPRTTTLRPPLDDQKRPEGSRYRGVAYDPNRKLWRSQVYVHGKTQYLGMYRSSEDAGRAHDHALIDKNITNHRGFNFPEEAEQYATRKHGLLRFSSPASSGVDVSREVAEADPGERPGEWPMDTEQQGRRTNADGQEPGITAAGRISSWSPEPRQDSGSTAPQLHALAGPCDGPEEGGSAGEIEGGTRSIPLARLEGPTSSGFDGIAGALQQPEGSFPIPMPRSRARKPAKRKRVDAMPDLLSGLPSRGRGRPKGSLGKGKGVRKVTPVLLDRGRQLRSAGQFGGVPSSPASAFHGVEWDPHQSSWKAFVMDNDRAREVGYYDTEEDAARAYDRAASSLRGLTLPLNFPELLPSQRRQQQRAGAHETVASFGRSGASIAGRSGLGARTLEVVSEHRSSETSDSEWEASPRQRHGSFARRPNTSRRAQGIAKRQREHGTGRSMLRKALSRRQFANRLQHKRRSQYRGVQFDDSSELWVAELRHHGKTTYVGRFGTEFAASKAYDAAGLERYGRMFPTNHLTHPELSGLSTSTSESGKDGSDEESTLLPPLPRWGRRVRLATHHLPSALEQRGTGWPLSKARNQARRPGTTHTAPPRAPQAPTPAAGWREAGARNLHNHSRLPLPGSLQALQGQMQTTVAKDESKRKPTSAACTAPAKKRPALSSSMHAACPSEATQQALPLGPLRLVESGGSLHLASDDPKTRASIITALHLPGNRGIAAAAPLCPPPGHLLTLPEKTKQALATTLNRDRKSLSANELLNIIGLSTSATRSPFPVNVPSIPPEEVNTWHHGLLNSSPIPGVFASQFGLPEAGMSQAAGVRKDDNAVPEATRTAYAALLHQHTQALAAALARSRGTPRSTGVSPKARVAVAEQANTANNMPPGFMGPHIPKALRVLGGPDTAMKHTREAAAVLEAHPPVSPGFAAFKPSLDNKTLARTVRPATHGSLKHPDTKLQHAPPRPRSPAPKEQMGKGASLGPTSKAAAWKSTARHSPPWRISSNARPGRDRSPAAMNRPSRAANSVVASGNDGEAKRSTQVNVSLGARITGFNSAIHTRPPAALGARSGGQVSAAANSGGGSRIVSSMTLQQANCNHSPKPFLSRVESGRPERFVDNVGHSPVGNERPLSGATSLPGTSLRDQLPAHRRDNSPQPNNAKAPYATKEPANGNAARQMEVDGLHADASPAAADDQQQCNQVTENGDAYAAPQGTQGDLAAAEAANAVQYSQNTSPKLTPDTHFPSAEQRTTTTPSSATREAKA